MTASPPARRAERLALFAAILASSMAFIDSTALGVAQPAIQAEFNMDAARLIWVTNAYALLLSALILVGGALGDLYGRRRIFSLGIIVFSAASLLCGLAPGADWLIAARGLQGIGGALMVPGSLALLSAVFPDERRGGAIGAWSTFSTLTTLLGPLLGGWLVEQGLWRWIFFINLPLAALALLALRGAPESRDPNAPRHLDYLGAALATLGLIGLSWGFTEAPAYGLTHPVILAALLGGAAALVAFVIVESRVAHPMMPLRLFRSATFSGANALTLFLYAALGVLPFFFSLNLIQVQGYPETQAGLALLPLGILLALLSRRAGRLADRVGARPLLTVGPLVAGIGFFLFALPGQTAGPADYWTTYFPAVVLLGVGMGITVAPLTTAVMSSAPRASSGAASGINNAVARTAGVLAIALLGAVVLVHFRDGLATRSADLGLSAEQTSALGAAAARLADTSAPAGFPPEAAAAVMAAVPAAFIASFQVVAVVSAALAWISALLAWLLVGRRSRPADAP